MLALPALGAALAPAGLVEVRLDGAGTRAIEAAGARPVAFLSDRAVVEADEGAQAVLDELGAEFRLLLGPAEFAAARQSRAFYVVTPPDGTSSAQRRSLERVARVLSEDGYSYLVVADSGFALSDASLPYELALVTFDRLSVPDPAAPLRKPGPGTPRPLYNAVIDSILTHITMAEVMQVTRELSGEQGVTIRGVLDTIATRWTTAAKNSAAVWYIYEKMLAAGIDSTAFHAFTWTSGTDSNVIGTQVGHDWPGRYWIIGGHLDSRSESSMVRAAGADDNGSGTVAAMLAAKYMAPWPFRYTVRYIAWNAEEQGLLGSTAHAALARSRNDTIMGVLNGDMIASELTNTDSIRIYTGTRPGAQAMRDTFARCCADYGLGLNVVPYNTMVANSDHAPYYNRNYDAVHAIENDFCPYYHTTRDRVTATSFDSVFYYRVIKAMVATIATLAQVDTVLPWHDVGVTHVIVPAGAYDSGRVVTPACSVYNYGNVSETYNVRMRIGGLFDETAVVTGHAAGTAAYVTFPAWTALPRGTLAVACSTELGADSVAANDRVTGEVSVAVHDVEVAAITSPAPAVPPGTVIPAARVRNNGTAREPVQVVFSIQAGQPYRDSVILPDGLPSADTSLSFRAWNAPPGRFSAGCTVRLATDQVPANDGKELRFTAGNSGWTEMSSMPAGAKAIKDGGWLAYDWGTKRIYASRGNKQPDFFAYAPSGDSWAARAPWQPGSEGKLPQKGSAGCADGNGFVYATKGNSTSGFWKYDAEANAWTQKKDVPLGLSNKKVKGGTDIVWAYNGLVGSPYLLKGYKNEFYRYDVAGDSWQSLAPAPVGAREKWDKGSWLAYDDVNGKVYAFKAKYMEFYRYSPNGDSWSAALAPMPIGGSTGSKKAKDGSCGTFDGADIWALKGGNTQQFFRWTVAANSWAEKETIPRGLDKRKVKAGGDIVSANSVLYAIKGNKSNELWMYLPGSFLLESSRHDGVEAGSFIVHRASFIVTPNPLRGGVATVSFTRPLNHLTAGPLTLCICDVTGRVVLKSPIAIRHSLSTFAQCRPACIW